ncbi:hypothetical protein KZ813_08355 [Sphingomonas sp. RHCKR7]|uniref:hypothetical protein n=1 Tax=Sphingomonas folli TaxID=2862497 RepID=UPI001CA4EE09|nr:hypothetical protein [Sphingomonas folli]MBW6526846.1 hypothetical protein [Sphingomonas folli]
MTLFASSLALTCAAAPCEATGLSIMSSKIIAVQVESGVPFITFDKALANPDKCAGAGVLTLPDEMKNQAYYLSLAMTALATGKPVDAWVDGCGWAPWTASPTVPKIYSLRIDD